LIKYNKKLKERDYDFRYMDLKDKEEHIPITSEPISIEIKQVKFNKPKLRKNIQLNDDY
jgi:hypothetical protein